MSSRPSDDVSPKFASHIYALLNTIFDVAFQYDFIVRSPMRSRIHKPRVEKAEKPALPVATVIQILNHMDRQHFPLFALLSSTGMRIGESSIGVAQSARPFVYSEFKVPEKLETDRFRLRMLTVNDVVKDYDAVMTSVDHLRSIFGPKSTWPAHDLTLEHDLIDLGWHQKEFQTRSSFAYTVMNPSETTCLGCVYIFPTRKCGYDAEVCLWVRKSEYEKGLDKGLFEAVRQWVGKEWPFKRVGYPGREVDWKTWGSLPEQ